MSQRRSMEAGDWFHVVVNLVIGVFLGSAGYNLLQLVISGSGLLALIMVILGAGFFGFLLLVEKLSDSIFNRLFPSGFKSSSAPRSEGPRPMLRLLSLPAGFLLGMVLAVVGWDRVLLDLLP